jgi:hypothetical protein
MARRPVPPPKPRPPILTAGQKRRRIERLQKCITSLEAFDHQKVRKRFGNPQVLTLEAAIDKALSSAFGYGTPSYLRYNLAAKLDPGPVIINAALADAAVRPVSAPARREAQAREASQYFSEGRERSIVLLREAIRTLEDEITDAQRIVVAPKESRAAEKTGKVQTPQLHPPQAATQPIVDAPPQLQPTRGDGFDLKATWRRVTRWLRGRN